MDAGNNDRNNSRPSAVRYLPEDYEASPYDVLCGRGRRCYFHAGNVRFRDIVQSNLAKYSATSSKMEKGYIISLVYEEICEQAGTGGFIKKDEQGRWYDVGEFLAREKVSQAFRDALQDKYKSSTASKKKRRELLAQSAELRSQRSLCSMTGGGEPTLEDLESVAIQNVRAASVSSSQLLHLLDKDIKHAFGSHHQHAVMTQQWEGYSNISFRGVDEMPVQQDRRQEMLETYRQPPTGHFELNRSCPILAWHGARGLGYSNNDDEDDDEDYEPLHYSVSEIHMEDMDLSAFEGLHK